jgi:DNA-binding transcriptional ArsR family regulator
VGSGFEMDEQLTLEIGLLHDSVCKGLSDPKRIMILYALNERPCYVSELAMDLKMPQPTVSRHLKVLRDCGLVTPTREASTVYYAITDERIIQALDLMRELLRDRVMKHARLVTADPSTNE